MEVDIDDVRQVPQGWRAYLANLAQTGRVFRWMWRELDTPVRNREFRRMVIALVVANTFLVLQSVTLLYVIDGLSGKNPKMLLGGLAAFLVCMVAQKIAGYHQSIAREWILGVNWGALDKRITELFFEKSVGQHLQESSSLSVANIDKGRWRLLDLQAMMLFEGTPVLFALALSVILLTVLSPVCGAIMLFVVAVHLGWMLYLNHRVVVVCTPIDQEFRRLNRHRVERWEQFERVQTSGKTEEEIVHMTEWFDEVIGNDRTFWLWFIRNCSFRDIASVLGLIAIAGLGSWNVWRGAWTLGMIYPLLSWSARVAENIWRVGQIEHLLNWNMPSVKSMIDALSTPPDLAHAQNPAALDRQDPVAVEFDRLTYTYPPGEEPNGGKQLLPVLREVSFGVAPGEKVAVIGSSGSGKTTIGRLLLRFMDPTSGAIRINGKDLRERSLLEWVAMVGYIPQQPQVLDGTIRYNLTYGLSKEDAQAVTDAELWRVMRLLQIDFGERLTHGLDTVVGRRGVKLSGGQAQRLMIGAAAVKRPRFMLVDEATSSLDSTTEKAVQEGLAEVLRGEVGAIVIAHRLSTVRHLCSKFVVLKPTEGLGSDETQVEAIAGSFEELYDLSPTFRQLAADQDLQISGAADLSVTVN